MHEHILQVESDQSHNHHFEPKNRITHNVIILFMQVQGLQEEDLEVSKPTIIQTKVCPTLIF